MRRCMWCHMRGQKNQRLPAALSPVSAALKACPQSSRALLLLFVNGVCVTLLLLIVIISNRIMVDIKY